MSSEQISKEQKAKIFDLFMQYDKDRNGYISYDEAHDVLHDKLGFNAAQSKKLVTLCDKNNDGQLSYEEFISFYTRVQDKMEELRSMFNEIDVNKDGHISMEEAKTALQNMAFKSEEIEALVISYDANGDGILQYEEFVQLWNAKWWLCFCIRINYNVIKMNSIVYTGKHIQYGYIA